MIVLEVNIVKLELLTELVNESVVGVKLVLIVPISVVNKTVWVAVSIGNTTEVVIMSVKIINDVSIGNATEGITMSTEVIGDIATIK